MFFALLTSGIALSLGGTPQPPPRDPRGTALEAVAVRAHQAPVLDGRADDAVWQTAPKFSSFRQFVPRVDVDPTFKTEFQVAYDEHNFYAFVRMYDPHPDSIKIGRAHV